ncbi:MAG: hypothetical protein IMF19_11075 [Proteobacteria bacterium]|nr:hypothetical protein [Pseudomonadota bacterium]
MSTPKFLYWLIKHEPCITGYVDQPSCYLFSQSVVHLSNGKYSTLFDLYGSRMEVSNVFENFKEDEKGIIENLSEIPINDSYRKLFTLETVGSSFDLIEKHKGRVIGPYVAHKKLECYFLFFSDESGLNGFLDEAHSMEEYTTITEEIFDPTDSDIGEEFLLHSFGFIFQIPLKIMLEKLHQSRIDHGDPAPPAFEYLNLERLYENCYDDCIEAQKRMHWIKPENERTPLAKEISHEFGLPKNRRDIEYILNEIGTFAYKYLTLRNPLIESLEHSEE